MTTTPGAVLDVRQVHDELLAVTDRLVAEWSGSVPAGRVMRAVARTAHGLRLGGVPAGELPARVEPTVREQLRARAL